MDADSAEWPLTIRRVMIAVARSYVVIDREGRTLFRVSGKPRFARTFSIRDDARSITWGAREKLLALDPTFIISQNGEATATMKRTSEGHGKADHFEVSMIDGRVLHASGRPWRDGGVSISDDGGRVAAIYRDQRTWRETFRFDAVDDERRAFLVAVAMSIIETYRHRGQLIQ